MNTSQSESSVEQQDGTLSNQTRVYGLALLNVMRSHRLIYFWCLVNPPVLKIVANLNVFTCGFPGSNIQGADHLQLCRHYDAIFTVLNTHGLNSSSMEVFVRI